MINHIFISFFTVQIYEISYIHFYDIGLHNTNTILVFEAVPNSVPKVNYFLTCRIQFDESKLFSSLPFYNVYNMKKKKSNLKQEGITTQAPKTNCSSGSTPARFCSKKSIPLQNVCPLLTGHYWSSHNWGGGSCGGGGDWGGGDGGGESRKIFG